MNLLKKIILPFSCLLFLCVGCSGSGDYHGKYTFSLGQEKSTHVAASVILGKNEQPQTTSSEKVPEPITIDVDVVSTKTLDFGASGTYTFEAKKEDGSQKINLDIDKIHYNGKEVELPTVVPTSIFDRVFLLTLNGKNVNLNIPISETDFLCQFYWYGLDLFDIATLTIDTTVYQHEVGTYPNEDDIARIKQGDGTGYYTDEAGVKHKIRPEFRAWWTLSLDLAKEDKK